MTARPLHDEIRRWWDEDAATYDAALGHRPRSAPERAAWTAAVARRLPEAPCRVLDCGAGTGFLTLIAARLGHHVTAVDLSAQMLARLREKASAEHLTVETVEGPAEEVPPGAYDAVMERHLLWTLPDPEAALGAWRRAVRRDGRLVLFGVLADPDTVGARLLASGRSWWRRIRRVPPDHHGAYPEAIRAALPKGPALNPRRYVEWAEAAGWRNVGLERLVEVEWATALRQRGMERALGVPPRFAVVARA